MQSAKMSKGKERPYEKVIMLCANKRKNDRQSPWKKMMIKIQRNLKPIKITNKGENLGQLPPSP